MKTKYRFACMTIMFLAEDIERFGYCSLDEVLDSIRGFFITYDRNYCYLGVTAGIELQGGSPVIVINRASALTEGGDFSSGLLNLARVSE